MKIKDDIENKMRDVISITNLKTVIEKDFHKKCPFCKGANFHVTTKNYLCEDCEESGDCVSYLMLKKTYSLSEAVNRLWKESRNEQQESEKATKAI